MRTRILFQAENVPDDLLSDVRVQLTEVPLSGGSDFSAAGRASVSEFPHEVARRPASAVTVINLDHARSARFGAGSIIGKIPVGRAPIALTFSPDERWLFTTSQVALKEWGWPAACKPENRPNVSDLVNPEGAVMAIDVARAKSDPAHAVVGRVPAGCSPVRMAISPSGDRIYATARNSNAVVSLMRAS